jgi:hypothetical protein
LLELAANNNAPEQIHLPRIIGSGLPTLIQQKPLDRLTEVLNGTPLMLTIQVFMLTFQAPLALLVKVGSALQQAPTLLKRKDSGLTDQAM